MSSSRGEILKDALTRAGQMSHALDEIKHALSAGDADDVGAAVTKLLTAKYNYDYLITKAAELA